MIRCSMASYYFAEDPTLSATEAIAKSQEAMADMTQTTVSLTVSFVVLSIFAQLFVRALLPAGLVLTLIVWQVLYIVLATYSNAAFASLYVTVSSKDGVTKARRKMNIMMKA
ncbi:MAG: hypothetical protein GX096_07150 [Clostridiales bacterium]|nr:hypothetical protein [Clostridiales bacterium]